MLLIMKMVPFLLVEHLYTSERVGPCFFKKPTNSEYPVPCDRLFYSRSQTPEN
jgi:hypothetical protein